VTGSDRPGPNANEEGRNVTILDMYVWREPDWSSLDLTGFKVEAMDGEIGEVHEDTRKLRGNCIVVDTGGWIFGDKMLLPAGTIQSVDIDEGRVFVDRTKEEIKNAPPFEEAKRDEETYRTVLGTYYGSRRAGTRETTRR
jgi:hypothetical protein